MTKQNPDLPVEKGMGQTLEKKHRSPGLLTVKKKEYKQGKKKEILDRILKLETKRRNKGSSRDRRKIENLSVVPTNTEKRSEVK